MSVAERPYIKLIRMPIRLFFIALCTTIVCLYVWVYVSLCVYVPVSVYLCVRTLSVDFYSFVPMKIQIDRNAISMKRKKHR